MKRFDRAMIRIRSATWRTPFLVSAIAFSSSFSGLNSCNCTMRPCGQLPTTHSGFVARGGQREGIVRAGVAIRKTRPLF
jgi:hypothetical protein